MRHLTVILALIATLTLAGCGAPRYVAPTAKLDAPPAGKALINLHYLNNGPKTSGYPLFDGHGKLIGHIRSHTLHQVVVDPGDHYFLSHDGTIGALKVTATAGNVYDAIADYTSFYWGGVVGFKSGVAMLWKAVPRTGELRDLVKAGEPDEVTVTLDRSAPDVAALEREYAAENAKALKAYTEGEQKKDLQVLPADWHR